MSPVQNFEQHSRHLVDSELTIQARLQMVMEPQFVDNPEHKLRNIVVEILNRLPHSEVLQPFVQDLLKVAMQGLTTDNEENGLICIRIIFDLLRNFRPTLENEVQPFLDFVWEDVKPMDTSLSDQGINPATGSQLNPSTRSFKIVTESPLVVMFLFQLYSHFVQANIPQLLPLMVTAISVPGPEKVHPHLRTHFTELKGAQVKTVSFLTYLLKSYADYIRPHEESICKSIVNLLVTCTDSVTIRKELLISLKHVLGTDFRRGLFPLIDTLLEQRNLVGTGRACFEMLRPLAYSLLAEIVHHIRQDLSLSQVAEGYPSSMKKALLLHFLNLFQSKQLGHDHLVIVMQMLILPMLAHAFQNGQSWKFFAEYDEPLRIELLQLATLLLKYLQNDLVHHRKELIKFGWNHLKREDTASKQWAFVNVCHFLEAYQAPEKIILQVFVALLRTCQPENRMLVRQALDILMPALPRRLPFGDSRMPIWIRYTKKILVEEGHSIPNLIHIFQLIVRHSDLFYSCRAQFVPQMVNSLSRLGLPYNITTENGRLAIELAGLVVNWERQRQNEMKVVTESDAPSQINDVFNASSAESKRSVEGSIFPDDTTKRVKADPGLQPLCVMSPGGPSSIPNIETPGSSSQPDEEFKPNAAMEMIINFLIRVALVIEPKDKEATAISSNDDNNAGAISFLLLVIKTLTEVQRNFIDPLVLVRLLQRLQRDMGSSAGSHLRQGQRTDPDSAVTSSRQGVDVGAVISNLKSILTLITERMMVVPECKRSVSQVLNALLSEKGVDASVLLCTLDVIKGWIEDDFTKQGTSVTSSSFLTPKEIVSFLQKLSQVDKQNFTPSNVDEWDQKYLELLFGICADSNKYLLSLRQEVFQEVERMFMLGLRARDPEIRMKFFSLYHESLGKTLFIRLQYIIQVQDWGTLSDGSTTSGTSSLLETSGMQHKVNDASEGAEDAPLAFETLVVKHTQFLNSMSKLEVADLLNPLRELAHTDANVAYHLWVLVFPIVWVTLHKEEQVTLAKPMIALLSKDYHKRQQASRPNVVQALLERASIEPSST
ncbi:non-specific serine/threonine protein kinase [Trifolium repens]|nr:non-specific serine/threonine protein kinase [Trifolium repens]